MNERIRSLAEQAGLRFTQLMSNPMVPVVDGKETDLEKFAELIVRECVSIMEWQKISPKDDGAYNSALSLAQRNIKEQFGVEQ